MADTYKAPSDTAADFTYSYEYGVCVDDGTGSDGAHNWLPIRFISAVDPSRSPKTKDAATYDDKGADNAPVVGESWTLSFTVQGHRSSTGGYLAEVERLMDLASPTATGSKATGSFLWFDKPANATAKANAKEAFIGTGTVDIKRQNTDNDSIGGFTVTITGQGPREPITNPYDPTSGALKFTPPAGA